MEEYIAKKKAEFMLHCHYDHIIAFFSNVNGITAKHAYAFNVYDVNGNKIPSKEDCRNLDEIIRSIITVLVMKIMRHFPNKKDLPDLQSPSEIVKIYADLPLLVDKSYTRPIREDRMDHFENMMNCVIKIVNHMTLVRNEVTKKVEKVNGYSLVSCFDLSIEMFGYFLDVMKKLLLGGSIAKNNDEFSGKVNFYVTKIKKEKETIKKKRSCLVEKRKLGKEDSSIHSKFNRELLDERSRVLSRIEDILEDENSSEEDSLSSLEEMLEDSEDSNRNEYILGVDDKGFIGYRDKERLHDVKENLIGKISDLGRLGLYDVLEYKSHEHISEEDLVRYNVEISYDWVPWTKPAPHSIFIPGMRHPKMFVEIAKKVASMTYKDYIKYLSLKMKTEHK